MFTAIISAFGAIVPSANASAQSQYQSQINARDAKRSALQFQQNSTYIKNISIVISICLVVFITVYFLFKQK